jgi:hypothetical protein
MLPSSLNIKFYLLHSGYCSELQTLRRISRSGEKKVRERSWCVLDGTSRGDRRLVRVGNFLAGKGNKFNDQPYKVLHCNKFRGNWSKHQKGSPSELEEMSGIKIPWFPRIQYRAKTTNLFLLWVPVLAFSLHGMHDTERWSLTKYSSSAGFSVVSHGAAAYLAPTFAFTRPR